MSIPDIYDLDNFNLPRTVKKYIVKYNINENIGEVYNEENIMIEKIEVSKKTSMNVFFKRYPSFMDKSKHYIYKYQEKYTPPQPRRFMFLKMERYDLNEYGQYVKYDNPFQMNNTLTLDMVICEVNYKLPKSITHIEPNRNTGMLLAHYRLGGADYVNVMRIYMKNLIEIPLTYIDIDRIKFIKKIKIGTPPLAVIYNMYKYGEYVVVIISDVYENTTYTNILNYENKKFNDYVECYAIDMAPNECVDTPELNDYLYYFNYMAYIDS